MIRNVLVAEARLVLRLKEREERKVSRSNNPRKEVTVMAIEEALRGAHPLKHRGQPPDSQGEHMFKASMRLPLVGRENASPNTSSFDGAERMDLFTGGVS
ncbi:hypothetical protein ACLOJK_019280 [Asimina triloba]